MGRPDERKTLGRPRCRWKGNIKWTYKHWDGGAWTASIWPRIRTGGALVTSVMNLWVP